MRRSRRGEWRSRSQRRVAGLFIIIVAWHKISSSMKVKKDERENRSASAVSMSSCWTLSLSVLRSCSTCSRTSPRLLTKR
ncbi:hypothetical protein D3C72_2431830 [compost metagenome]